MPKSLSLCGFFEDGKYPKLILAVGAIFLLFLQLAIFIAVYNQSGLKSRVFILDSNGRKIYESSSPTLSAYEKMMFENNFGPLRNYTTEIESELVPFNYRAWILLARRNSYWSHPDALFHGAGLAHSSQRKPRRGNL